MVNKETTQEEDFHSDIVYPAAVPFILAHLSLVGIIWTGVSAWSLAMCAAFYLVRMFGVTAGYHRYFSHKSYKTSRVGQFLLALLAQSSAQRGVLWWASKHRDHHKHSDTELDPHSPVHTGFWFSHMGWIFSRTKFEADYSRVPDLTKYPELVFLDKHQYIVPVGLGVLVWFLTGWEGLFVGYLLSTVILFHGTFMINSLAHVKGKKVYVTGDESRNNWLLALITLGEGWHNNHHHFQSAARQGFRWYEIDLSYYALKALSWTGLVWDLKAPPEEVVLGKTRLRTVVVEKVAAEVAGSFSVEKIAAEIREKWNHGTSLEEIRERAQQAYANAQTAIADLHFPQLPTADELKRRAREMYSASATSMDEIAERARELIREQVSQYLFGDPNLLPA